MAQFCSLYSGSSGNCTYIGAPSGGILIDVGVSAKRADEALSAAGIDVERIDAVFVTHEHTDHINGLRVFLKRHRNISVYASPKTLAEMERLNALPEECDAREISSDGVESAGMFIRSFRTSHDAAESVGYTVVTQDGRRVAVATDTGCVTEEIMHALFGCDLVMLESNHDIGMLQNGFYPYYLKRRILSDRGHLSNDACADTARRLIDGGTTRLVLGHLSRENNMPQLAYQATQMTLSSAGAKLNEDYILNVAGTDNGVIYL